MTALSPFLAINKLGSQTPGRPLNCVPGREDGEQCGVEQLVLQHYAREGGCHITHRDRVSFGLYISISHY